MCQRHNHTLLAETLPPLTGGQGTGDMGQGVVQVKGVGIQRKKRDTFSTFVNVFNDVQTAFSFDTLKTVEVASDGLRGCPRKKWDSMRV